MNVNKMKNFVIIALVITAVYQTGRLWLEDITGHNLFYTLFSVQDRDSLSQGNSYAMMRPEALVLCYGNKKYTKLMTGSDYEAFLQQGDSLMKSSLKNSAYLGETEADWQSYVSQKALLYQFAFPVQAAEYTKVFGTETEGDNSGRFFDAVSILPGRTSAEETKLYFIYTAENKAYGYRLAKSKEADALYYALEEYQQNQNEKLFYLYARENGFHLFAPDVFLPQWIDTSYSYPLYTSSKSFEENGKADLGLLEDGIIGFFGGNLPGWNTKDEGSYIFSSDTTVVKYFLSGVLEYYNYSSAEGTKTQTLLSAYNACIQFLKKDTTLKNSIYLSGIRADEGGLVLQFDYTVEQFPVSLSKEIQDKVGMTHSIELLVRNNMVKKYRRYAVSLQKENRQGHINIDFSQALDRALGNYTQEEAVKQVEAMGLFYEMGTQKEIELKWMLTMDGERYLEAARR